MRVMGVDFGEKRIGLAVKRRASKKPPLRAMEDVARNHEAEALVVGLPLSPGGRETDWSREVRWVGNALAERLSIPVYFVDERFTSARAERAVRSSGLPQKKVRDKGRIDAGAAVFILQSWLDRSPESRESTL
jgi:putative Holliday junction resolvase